MGRVIRKLAPEVVQAWLEASCAAQGVPLKVTDAAIVTQVARLINPRLGQSRQTVETREGSKVVRPRTAGPTTARSTRDETMACCRGSGRAGQRSRRAADSPM
jgi:hypothetical protein